MNQKVNLSERHSALRPSGRRREPPRRSSRLSGLANAGCNGLINDYDLLKSISRAPGVRSTRLQASAELTTPMHATINRLAIDRDAELVEALRLRKATAAERLFATFGDRAYRLAMGITGNHQDAEDAVQDAFWSVARKIDTFRGDSAFGSWFYRIVSNAAYGKVRRRRRAHVEISFDGAVRPFHDDGHHEDLQADCSCSLDDPAEQTELRAVLNSAVSELPPHYRTAIALHDVEGLSMAEVAEALGITVAMAKTRAHRARVLLRKRLSIYMASAGASGEGVAGEEYERGVISGTRPPVSAPER